MKRRKTNTAISEKFIKSLFETTAGYLSKEEFQKLIDTIESHCLKNYFDQNGEANLLRIIQASHDKVYFLHDILSYEINRDAILTVAQNSDYLTEILIRNPEYFYYSINPPNENQKANENNYEYSLRNSLSKFKSFESKVRILKSFKRKEMLRIGIRDILFDCRLETITAELSQLAKVICSCLFELCLQRILMKYSVQKLVDDYCIIALGKLGGNELNYSSDIDLMIFYDAEEQTTELKSKKEILTEAIILFIQTSTENNEDGFLYRIDFRLRPDGRNAPLCNTLTNYLNYYESRGEDWERQMLLKSSFVCGHIKLFDKFFNYLRSFIYPASFSISPFQQIKKLRLNIENKISEEQNIKLSPGGIRDIEFSIQVLQLINGGKISDLREPNTLIAISKLEHHNLLSNEEAVSLKENYIFFRKIEHFLQLMNNRQTHSIPEDEPTRKKLSRFLRFDNFYELNNELLKRSHKIISIRDSIFGSAVEIRESNGWFRLINFENAQQAKRNIQFLREGMGVSGNRIFDKNSIEAFSKIEDEFFRQLSQCIYPDLALNNFVKIISLSDFPSVWYTQLQNANLLNALIALCQFNQHAVDLLFNNEINKDIFLSGRFSNDISGLNLTNYALENILFVLSVQFILGLTTAEKLSQRLKEYLSQIILDTAAKMLHRKISKSKYFIASLGSFSTTDMNFASDIDLLFIVKDLQNSKSAQNTFQRFLLELKSKLKPFDVDCRLRPEGKSSNLVWDLNSSITYINSRARIWELQAFTKINFFTGNVELYNNFYLAIQNRITAEDRLKIYNEIVSMHRKLIAHSASDFVKIDLKKSKGGINDLEFIIQYLLLCNADQFYLCSGKSISEIIGHLKKSITTEIPISNIALNYKQLKDMQLLVQAIFNISNSKVPTAEREKNILLRFFVNYRNNNFDTTLNKIFKENNQMFNSVFRGTH